MSTANCHNRKVPLAYLPLKEEDCARARFTKGTVPAGTADAPAKLHDSAKVDRAGDAAMLPFV